MLASDLHVHLDGSLRDATLLALARSHGIVPASVSDEDYLEVLRFSQGMSLRSCLARFETTVGLLQTASALKRASSELVSDSYTDGVRHVEIRFCPALHTRRGLSENEAIEAVIDGLDAGRRLALASAPDDLMSAGVIVSVLEGMDEGRVDALVELAATHIDSGVVGVDLAGDESLFDPAPFRGPFTRAREAGLGVTVHAGEGHDTSHIVSAVLDLGAARVGHGTSAASDAGALSLLSERQVTVEVCISSNLHTGAIGSLAEHPLNLLAEARVPVVVCTDNRFFSNTSLSREYELAVIEVGASPATVAGSVLRGAAAAFLPDGDRESLAALYSSSLERARDAEPERRGS